MITTGALDIDPDDVKSLLSSLLPRMRLALGLHSKDWGVAIDFQVKDDGDFAIKIQDAEVGQSCWDSSLQKFADKIRKKLETKAALVLETDELIPVLDRAMQLGIGYNEDSFAALLATLGKLFPKYGSAYAISPKPNLYKRRYKWAYGIDLTLEIRIPTSAVIRGLPLFLGANGAFVLGIVSRRNASHILQALFQIRLKGPLLIRVKSLDKDHYSQIIAHALKKREKTALMEATKALKFAVTEETEEWPNYCILLEKSTLSNMILRIMEFAKHMFWTSLLSPGEFRRFIRRYMSQESLRRLLEEKLTVYPSNPIFKLIEEKGIWTFKWPL